MSSLSQVRKLGVAASEYFFVTRPALERRTCEAIELELEVWVAKDGRIEGKRIGGSCACT